MQQKSVRLNFVYNAGYQVLSLITPLITAPYIARVVGVNGIGMYSYTQSIVIYFTLIAGLGSGTHGQRGIAGERNDKEKMTKFFYEIVLLRFLTTAISLVLYGIFVATQNNEYKTLYLIQFIDIAACAFDISWFYQGLENFKKTVTRQIIIKMVGVCSILLFVKESSDLPIYVLCYSVPTLLGNLFLWPGIKKQLCRIKIKEIHPLKNLKPEIELFIPYVGTLIFSYVDKTMLGIMSGSAENGYYEQALKFISIGINILNALSVVLVPRMAYLYKASESQQFVEYIKKGIQSITLLSCLIAAGLFAVGGSLIPWFYGEGYERSIILLQIMSFMLILKGINNFVGSAILIPTFKQRKYTIQIWLSTGVNVLLNLILIPKFEASGAAAASVLSETVMFAISFIYLGEFISRHTVLKSIWKYIISASVAGGFTFMIQTQLLSNIFNTILLSVCCCVIYSLSLIAMNDGLIIKTVKQIIRRVKRGGVFAKYPASLKNIFLQQFHCNGNSVSVLSSF